LFKHVVEQGAAASPIQKKQRIGHLTFYPRGYSIARQGIAPFYADKYAKVGIQVADLVDAARLRDKLATSLVAKNVHFEHLYHRPRLDPEDIVPELLAAGERIEPFVCDTVSLLHEAPALL
jgi:adenylosuccinate synthase